MRGWFKAICIVIALCLLLAALTALPTMLLWNWLMPVIFGLGKITFWQAMGINMLCSILFKTSSVELNKD
ncbi:MAG: hypothetical protein II453_04315 [Alphaproteobacteria bacterium]|nr:hypothetical protein [Alphaproteobacteria bacterium]